MKSKIIYLSARILRNTDGATAIEYGLIAAGIALAIVSVVFLMGDQLEVVFQSMVTPMVSANAEIETSR